MKYYRAANKEDPEDVLYLSSSCEEDTLQDLKKRARIEEYGYELTECTENEFNVMTQEENDYIINVGQDTEDCGPFESAHTEYEAIERAEELCKEYKCVEIVYMPQDNIDINEIIWSRYLCS